MTNKLSSSKIKGLALGGLATFFWASFYVISRLTYGKSEVSIDPLFMSFIRFFCASIFFSIIILWRKEAKVAKIAITKDFKIFILLALAGIFLQGVLIFYSLKFTTAIRSSLCANTAPIFTVIIAYVFLKEPLSRYRFIGMLIGFAGLLITVLGNKGSDIFAEKANLFGDFIAVMCGICWAVYTVAGIKVSEKYGGLLSAAISIILGTLSIFTFIVISGREMTFNLPYKLWFAMIYLGVCGNGLAFVCWLAALKYLTPSELGSFGYLTPAITILLAMIFLDEKVNLVFWVGLALILIGTWMMTKRQTAGLTTESMSMAEEI